MIAGRYKPHKLIKETNGKRVEAAYHDKLSVILKSYSEAQASALRAEISTFQKLKDPRLHGFPQIKGVVNEKGRVYLVIEELGPDLESLRQACGGQLSLKTVLMLGIQMIERLEYIHSRGILHGDIKPSNFLMGLGKMKHKLYLTDFQLAEPFMINGSHAPFTNKNSMSGSFKFCSPSSNEGYQLTRKAELQSLLFCLVFLLRGQLPWDGIQSDYVSAVAKKIASLKRESWSSLSHGIQQLKTFMRLTQAMKYDSEPPYAALRQSLQDGLKKSGYTVDYSYDWDHY